jgi:SAM-dependent methyltransferase
MRIIVDSVCPICDNKEYYSLFSARSQEESSQSTYQIISCTNCGLSRTYPEPDGTELTDLYSLGLYGKSSIPSLADRLNNWLQSERLRYLKSFHKPGSLLDVGCGKGRFLSSVKTLGWQAVGFEPVDSRREWAESHYGVQVYLGELDDLRLPNRYFDVITLWHSLEHVRDPGHILAQVKKKLKDEGVLIVSVPNFASVQARFGRGQWFHLDVPRHLYHFDRKSLNVLLRKEGFEAISINTWSLEYNILGFAETICTKFGGEMGAISRLIKDRFSFFKKRSYTKCLWDLGIILFTLIPAMPIIIMISVCSSALGKGGTLTVVACKKLNHCP